MSRLAFNRDQLHSENIAEMIRTHGQKARVYRISVQLEEDELLEIGFDREMPDDSFLKTIDVFCELESVEDNEGMPGKKTNKSLSAMTLDKLVVQPDDYLVIDGEKYRVNASTKVHRVRHLGLEKVK